MKTVALLLVTAATFAVPGLAGTVYSFQDIVNPGDPTFNQELGINNAGTIAGYFGSGAPNGSPPPYTLVGLPTRGTRWLRLTRLSRRKTSLAAPRPR